MGGDVAERYEAVGAEALGGEHGVVAGTPRQQVSGPSGPRTGGPAIAPRSPARSSSPQRLGTARHGEATRRRGAAHPAATIPSPGGDRCARSASGSAGRHRRDVDEPQSEGELVRVVAAGIGAACPTSSTWKPAARRSSATRSRASWRTAHRSRSRGSSAAGRASGATRQLQPLRALRARRARHDRAPRHGRVLPGAGTSHRAAARRTPPEDASLVEPGSVAWHACRSAGVDATTRVAIVGAGAIGILTVIAATASARPRSVSRLGTPTNESWVERFGATATRGLYDVVIETAGSESGLHRAVELGATGRDGDVRRRVPRRHQLARAGRLRQGGRHPAPLGYCAHGDHREFDDVAALLAAHPVIPAALDHAPLRHRRRGGSVRRRRDRSKGAVRVMVHPS